MLIEGKELVVSEGALCGDALREALSGKKFKSALACACGETMLDLTATIPAGCTELTPIYADSPQGLQLLRHSTAHIMAEAVQRLNAGEPDAAKAADLRALLFEYLPHIDWPAYRELGGE